MRVDAMARVLRSRGRMNISHILLTTDFGQSSRQARDVAITVAQRFNAKLTLLHVCEVPSYLYAGAPYTPADLITPIRDGAREALEKELVEVRAVFPSAASLLREGFASHEIVSAASEQHADLIVMGTHGRRGVPRALLGSVAEKVVRMAAVPVITVPTH
jgi:nucleotide-binding universal stress UspA family protein